MNEINLVLNGASVMILIMRRGPHVLLLGSFRLFLSAGGAHLFVASERDCLLVERAQL